MRQNDIDFGELKGVCKSLIRDIRNFRSDLKDTRKTVKEDLKATREVLENQIKDLDTRVRKIEKNQYAIIIIASLIFTAIMAFFKKFFNI